jgi:hypothetical protein
MATIAAATPVIWNNIKIEYVGETYFDYALDGKDRNALIKLTNVGLTTVNNLYYQVAINGLGDYPTPTGDGGFAVFPNGGSIDLAPGQSYVAQNWLSGIYEGRFNNTPPASGASKVYTFDFLISTDNQVFRDANPLADATKAFKLTQDIEFENISYASGLTGPMSISGTLTNTQLATNNLTVEIGTPYSSWYRLTVNQTGNTASFSGNVPDRDDWIIRISGQGIKSETILASEINAQSTQLAVALEAAPSVTTGYSVLKTDDAPTGFWKGEVSESEQTFVLIPGQENWAGLDNTALSFQYREASEIRKYDFNGNLLWRYSPGWETWGGDMTADGSAVVYLVNSAVTSFGARPDFEIGVLDGRTGALRWTRTDATRSKIPYIGGAEAAISDSGLYVASGSDTGALGLMSAATGVEIWSHARDTYGQVRKLVFYDDFLYVGTGDGYLYKLNVADGSQVWKTYVGGWPFVNGLDISDDGLLISVGTKSKDTSLVRADTGEVLWSHQTGSLDAVISPNKQYVANFAGDIFSAETGELIGQTNMSATVHFSADSKYVIQVDRGRINVSDLSGKLIGRYEDTTDTEYGGGEQAQWTYQSADGSRMIVASRDMDTPGERALTIWKFDPAAVSTVNTGASSGSGSSGGDSRPTRPPVVGAATDDRFNATNDNDIVDGAGGANTFVYMLPSSAVTSFDFTADGLGVVLSGSGGRDSLTNIQQIEFSDKTLTPYALRSLFTPTTGFSVIQNNVPTTVMPTFFTGAESLNLNYQMIDTNPGAIIVGSTLNDFIVLQGGGNKAVNGGQGNDVIDGGVGSTFVSGGGGSNTFFLDGRASGISWSTITDFQFGQDKATIWGWKQGVSRVAAFEANGGATGFSGLTLHFENLLPDGSASGATNANFNSITLTGKTLQDFGASSVAELNQQIASGSNSHFLVGQTNDAYGEHGYLFIS